MRQQTIQFAIKIDTMQIRFNSQYLSDLSENLRVIGKPKFSKPIIERFKGVLKTIRLVESSQDLYRFKGLHFEKLKGNLEGYHSLRVDKKYRLIISIERDEVLVQEIAVVEDLTNHYGD